MFRIVLFPQIIRSLKEILLESTSVFHIKGRHFEEEYVYQLETLIDGPTKFIPQVQLALDYGIVGNVSIATTNANLPKKKLITIELNNGLIFDITMDEIVKTRRFQKNATLIDHNDVSKEIEIEILNSDGSRLFTRVDHLTNYPLKILNEKKIVIIGLGSGGSKIALDIVRAGVQNLLLLDDDIFEEHNIVRHILSLKDVGRYKTHAVRDYLLDRIPDLNISTMEENFQIDTKIDEEKYQKILKDYDLLISATGDHNINLRINQFAYQYGKPVIYAGTFDKITGGIMIRVNPMMADLCYRCIYDDSNTNQNYDRAKDTSEFLFNTQIPQTIPSEQSIVYDRNLEDILSQPGLGIDIDNITIFVIKFIIYNLIKDNVEDSGISSDGVDYRIVNTRHKTQASKMDAEKFGNTLYEFPYAIYLWYNRDIPKGLLSNCPPINGLELYYYDDNTINKIIHKRPNECSICNIRHVGRMLSD